MNRIKKEFSFAFVQTIPVMLGYLCLGFAFGLMMQDAGYHVFWAFLCSLFVYAGSMQFVLVTLLTSGASLLYAVIMTLFINGRQIFYGLSLIDRFRNMGKYYLYMVFSLTDETYSLLCSVEVPKELDEKKSLFLISLLDQLYWILGSVLGALAGSVLHMNTKGVDFSMTALFLAIVVNQWMDQKSHISAWAGLVCGALSLVLLGPDKFLLPALTGAALFLILFSRCGNEKTKEEA